MYRFLIRTAMLATMCLLVSGCNEDAPGPTGPARVSAQDAMHNAHGASASVVTADLTPFTFRASLDPYRIHQLPDFLMHSRTRTDIVIQRSIFNPGPGPWHTHPGPSFVYVIDGEIKLQRYNSRAGCHETPVYRTGEAYSEIAEEVHRAIVTSATPAVLLVTRFNMPIGAPISTPAADPGC